MNPTTYLTVAGLVLLAVASLYAVAALAEPRIAARRRATELTHNARIALWCVTSGALADELPIVLARALRTESERDMALARSVCSSAYERLRDHDFVATAERFRLDVEPLTGAWS